MSNKFTQWFRAVRDQSAHGSAATRADIARTDLVGKGTLVEKHLRRISERERTLQAFCKIIADSPALNQDDQ